MIIGLVKIQTSAKDIDAIREAIATMETASRAEPGCLEYTFSVELNQPEVLLVTERWESMEALAAHFQSPHMAAFQAAIAEYQPKDMQVNFYDAQERDGAIRV